MCDDAGLDEGWHGGRGIVLYNEEKGLHEDKYTVDEMQIVTSVIDDGLLQWDVCNLSWSVYLKGTWSSYHCSGPRAKVQY